jgi:hypothetical protein
MNRFSSHWRKALMILPVFALTSLLAAAADQGRSTGDGMFIATTGRIVAIDLQNRMLRVRGSDTEPLRNLIRPKHRFASSMISLPGLGIHIPLRVDRNPSKTSANTPNLDEYTVVITNQTLIQDGGDPIHLEDFSEGETISIHGVLHRHMLKASRISKWS